MGIIIDEIDDIFLNNLKNNTTELLDNFHGYKFLEYINSYLYNKLSEIDKNIKQYLLNKNQKKTDIINDYQL